MRSILDGYNQSRRKLTGRITKEVLFVLCIFLMASCKKDAEEKLGPQTVNHTLSFNIRYEVDGQPLIFDSLIYFNDAGNHYKISGLIYFLSQISLVKQDSSGVKIMDYQYLDASVASTGKFSITNPPAGNYIGIRFNIGIDSVHNITGGLPNNTNNNNMEWPEMMGGGYHIMKFEGYFEDGGNQYGFAMHLGMNSCVVPVQLFRPIVISDNNSSLTMTMNLNEWFRNPAIYDFNVDGNYTMGDMNLMMKLSMNGRDVFHI